MYFREISLMIRLFQDWAGYEKYDIVVANILADVIIMLVKGDPGTLEKWVDISLLPVLST